MHGSPYTDHLFSSYPARSRAPNFLALLWRERTAVRMVAPILTSPLARMREGIIHGIPASLVKVAPLHPSELENITLRRSGCRAHQSAVMRVPPHRRSLGKDSATEHPRFACATCPQRFPPKFRRQ